MKNYLRIRTVNYKQDGEDKVKYYIGGDSYDSFEDMKERGMSDADIRHIEKELWRKHEERKILGNIKYPTKVILELRKLEKGINKLMAFFGMKQGGSIGTFPCFFGTDKCQEYENGTVIWHNRGGASKITKKGTWRQGWTKTDWVEPYFKCLSCSEKVGLKDAIPILTKYYNARRTN